MRLIDADKLDAEMYHKSFEVDDGRNVWHSGLWIRYKIFEEALRDAPTVDAVPVIRCRNCTYYHSFDDESGVCKGGLGDCNMVSADGFCDWAVKRNEEDKKI